MTMPVVVLPDAEQLLRDHLRTVDLAGATKRVFKGRPQDGRTPYVVIDGRVGGAPLDEVPVDLPRVQITVWSTSRDEAFNVAARVVAHLRAAEAVLLPGGRLDGVTVTGGPVFAPDQASGMARYLITALVAVRPVS